MAVERKGLRFEVFPEKIVTRVEGAIGFNTEWAWVMVGADGPLARSFTTYDTEKECRSALAADKGRLGNAKRAKVITLEEEPSDYFDE